MLGRTIGMLAALALGGCVDPVDEAAKRRIFSPEDPPQVIASASEPLKAEELERDPGMARRILTMGAAEATERIGPHKFEAAVKFDWRTGEEGVSLLETRTLLAARGGVSGDFKALLENSRDQGLEVLRVHGKVYARSRHGRYRQRLRDRGMAERQRDEIFRAVHDFNALFRSRLSLSARGTELVGNRRTFRYVVGLGPEQPAGELATSAALPAPIHLRRGEVDETTRRRLAFFERREPESLSGELWVDEETGVVLKARMEGRIGVPKGEHDPASLRVFLDASVTAIGKEWGLSPPKAFLPDEDKPQGIAEALDQFGMPRQGKQPAQAAEDPPDDE